jgi:hypothetical protein
MRIRRCNIIKQQNKKYESNWRIYLKNLVLIEYHSKLNRIILNDLESKIIVSKSSIACGAVGGCLLTALN